MFFFYSVTDVISNVAKYNTSVKIYLSKSKITDFKNYLKITKYTKKLLNYSNVSKSNLLLYTSADYIINRTSFYHYGSSLEIGASFMSTDPLPAIAYLSVRRRVS